MKRNRILPGLIAALVLAVSIAYAGHGGAMRVYVPFEFYLEDQLLPAGHYNFEMGRGLVPTASVVTVRSREGAGLRIMLTRPDANSSSRISHLKFNRYDDRYFLCAVSIGEFRANVRMSPLEKELRARNQPPRTRILIAQK